MNEIVTPLYLAFACLFLGLTMAALPGLDRRLRPSERAGRYGIYSGVMAAAACVCIALVPWLGRALLPVSTLCLWAGFLATGMRVRSWHQKPTPLFKRRSVLTLVLAIVAMLVQFFTVESRDVRVIYQLCVSVVLLGWILFELHKARRVAPSGQLQLMALSTAGLLLVLFVWSWTLLFGNQPRLVYFSALFSEEFLAFSMRLFVVSCLALMLISANGYALERMVIMKSDASTQKARTEDLNRQLNDLLNEKNSMLQALSFAARSQNLPAIMSSLSHEINQPLGAIRLNADYLLAEDAKLQPRDRAQLLEQLVAGSVAINGVMRSFRRFFEANLTPHVPVSLTELLQDLVRGFRTELAREQVAVKLTQDVEVRVMGDPVQLESALTGVLQFMVQHRQDKPAQLHIRVQRIDRFVHVRMLIEGMTIHESLFTDALDLAHSSGYPSSGSSLWLSRAIVEHHGGAMNLHTDRRWAGISLQLPVMKEEAHEQ